jgi:hypothetical protein
MKKARKRGARWQQLSAGALAGILREVGRPARSLSEPAKQELLKRINQNLAHASRFDAPATQSGQYAKNNCCVPTLHILSRQTATRRR